MGAVAIGLVAEHSGLTDRFGRTDMSTEVSFQNEPSMIALMRASRKQLKGKEQKLQERIQESQRELKRVRAQLSHLDGFLSLEDGVNPQRVSASARSSGAEICNMVETILRENKNAPTHYSRLTEEVQRRGVVIGGTDPERTLLSSIGKDKRFYRPEKRGQYALREQHWAQLEGKHKGGAGRGAGDSSRSSSRHLGGRIERNPQGGSISFREVGEIPF